MVISLNFKMTPVAEPTRAGSWNFLYWANAANDNEWNFATNTVTGNITLKAIWTEDPVFIVSFNTGAGGSTVSSYNVKKDENAHDPGVIPTTTATTTTLPTTAGLYRGTGASDPVAMAQVFVEWRAPGGTSAFDFNNTPITADIALTAHWALAPRIASVAVNRVDLAVNYVRSNASAGEYTLLLDSDTPINTVYQNFNTANMRLTIIGLGAERTILMSSSSSTRRLFYLSAGGVSLTLGNNITLQGISVPSDSLIRVENGGSLTMLDGSKITGVTHTAHTTGGSGNHTAAVHVYANSSFIMSGGTITGNTGGNGGGSGTGGVYLSETTATFTMSGGSITGNIGQSGNPMDVRFQDFNAANHTKTGGTIGASNRSGFEGTGPGT